VGADHLTALVLAAGGSSARTRAGSASGSGCDRVVCASAEPTAASKSPAPSHSENPIEIGKHHIARSLTGTAGTIQRRQPPTAMRQAMTP